MPSEDKRAQEERSLIHIGDSFRKIILVNDHISPWYDDNGVTIMPVRQFLLEDNDTLFQQATGRCHKKRYMNLRG